MEVIHKKDSGKVYRKHTAFLFLLPFILFFCSLFFISVYFFQTYMEETAFFSIIVGNSVPKQATNENVGFVPGVRPSSLERIPSISYGCQVARLNVIWREGGWEMTNIPVYLGADKDLLKKGAGMSYASFFPGEKGCTIISAHVTRYFHELEATPLGASIMLDTSYGPYRYEVVKVVPGIKGSDRWYMDSSQPYDLILYSCYPRDNDGKRRTERCALCCKLVDGLEVSK